MLLRAEKITKTYAGPGRTSIPALRGVTVAAKAGTCRGVVGESGCGKSTLCRIMAGIEAPDGGRVLYQGKPFAGRYQKECRSQVQMVFQNSLDAVQPYVSVFKTVREPLKNFFHQNRRDSREWVKELFALVGLDGEDMDKYPYQFSGGQLQRVCIARALAARPAVMLMDEPLSSLDVSVQAQILNLLADLKSSLSLTYVLISHDLEAVYYLADSITVMYGGLVMEEIDDIRDFSSMSHPYTKMLLSHAEDWSIDMDTAAGGSAQLSCGCPFAPRCPYADKDCEAHQPPLTEVKSGHRIACLRYGEAER